VRDFSTLFFFLFPMKEKLMALSAGALLLAGSVLAAGTAPHAKMAARKSCPVTKACPASSCQSGTTGCPPRPGCCVK